MLLKLSELSQLKVLTILMGHPVVDSRSGEYMISSDLKPCGEVCGLEDCAHGGGLVGVEAVPELPLLAPLRRLEELEQLLLHPRHPGPAADKDNLARNKSAAFPGQILQSLH